MQFNIRISQVKEETPYSRNANSYLRMKLKRRRLYWENLCYLTQSKSQALGACHRTTAAIIYFKKRTSLKKFKTYIKRRAKKKVRTLDNEMQFSRYLSSCIKVKDALSFH